MVPTTLQHGASLHGNSYEARVLNQVTFDAWLCGLCQGAELTPFEFAGLIGKLADEERISGVEQTHIVHYYIYSQYEQRTDADPEYRTLYAEHRAVMKDRDFDDLDSTEKEQIEDIERRQAERAVVIQDAMKVELSESSEIIAENLTMESATPAMFEKLADAGRLIHIQRKQLLLQAGIL